MLTRRQFLLTTIPGWLGLAVPPLGRGDDHPLRRLYAPAQEAVEKGLAFLAENQVREGPLVGAFGEDRFQGHTAITSLAALAFMSGGHLPGRGTYGSVVRDALRYVLGQVGESGLLHNPQTSSGTSQYGSSYSHGFGTLFLADLHGMVQEQPLALRLKEVLHRAVRLILDTQTDEGGWRYLPAAGVEADISVTVAQVTALRAARNAGLAVPGRAMERGADYLKQCQVLPAGGFLYTAPRDKRQGQGGPLAFPRSAAGLVGLHCCGLYEGAEVEAARQYLWRFLPSRRPRPVIEAHFLYGHYYAVQALWQAQRATATVAGKSGAECWREWYTAVRDELCQPDSESATTVRRHADGSWSDRSFGSHYATALACLILQVPKNLLPIFQN